MSTYKDIIKKIKPEIDRVVSFFEKELSGIQASKISPLLVENIVVEYLGNRFPLKQLGAISLEGPRKIVIQPWDKSYIEPIVKAISQSNIGAAPIVDKDLVRINFPPLTEENRKSLVRILSSKQEAARKTIRRWREDAWREIQNGFRNGDISEDDKFRAKKELQDLVGEYNNEIERIGEKKKREIEG